MRVICIDGVKIGDIGKNDKTGGTIRAKSDACIYEGETYTVAHDYGDTYMLAGRNPFYSYNKRKFSPLSEIDETQMERNYNKELV